jgi:hypothetical protein
MMMISFLVWLGQLVDRVIHAIAGCDPMGKDMDNYYE